MTLNTGADIRRNTQAAIDQLTAQQKATKEDA
jgi:hypothetical protein